ncbi:MAG: TIM barrel protein [Verrucomicrobiota bacterium]
MKSPKLHNAMWPGVVGKGPDSEPAISLEKMIELTAKAEVDGQKFDGIDIFLSDPHLSIDSSERNLAPLAAKLGELNLKVGTVVAPVWEPTGGGSAAGNLEERKRFLMQFRKACEIAKAFRSLGVRDYGCIRIDSATDVETWAKDPVGNTRRIAETFAEAATIAEAYGERIAAEGEICWGGMHSWKHMIETLELVGKPETLGFQADLAHSMLYLLGYNAEEHRLLPENFSWDDKETFAKAYSEMTDALRPWTIDFHVAQNDGTVKGQGSHDKTGKHCLADDPNGKLDISWAAGFWLRENGEPLTRFEHICWDGCMFSNETLLQQSTWNTILKAMIEVRNAHGFELETVVG